MRAHWLEQIYQKQYAQQKKGPWDRIEWSFYPVPLAARYPSGWVPLVVGSGLVPRTNSIRSGSLLDTRRQPGMMLTLRRESARGGWRGGARDSRRGGAGDSRRAASAARTTNHDGGVGVVIEILRWKRSCNGEEDRRPSPVARRRLLFTTEGSGGLIPCRGLLRPAGSSSSCEGSRTPPPGGITKGQGIKWKQAKDKKILCTHGLDIIVSVATRSTATLGSWVSLLAVSSRVSLGAIGTAASPSTSSRGSLLQLSHLLVQLSGELAILFIEFANAVLGNPIIPLFIGWLAMCLMIARRT